MNWRICAVILGLVGCDGTLGTDLPPETSHLVNGTVQLVGDTGTTCSSGTGGADIWCAFARSDADGVASLWVLNISRATREPTPCDGTSSGCLLLSSTLWTGDPVFSPA